MGYVKPFDVISLCAKTNIYICMCFPLVFPFAFVGTYWGKRLRESGVGIVIHPLTSVFRGAQQARVDSFALCEEESIALELPIGLCLRQWTCNV